MKNKTYIVTGASSGIGFETAILLQKKGANVIWASRNIENDKRAIENLKNGSRLMNLNVGDEVSVKAFFSKIRSENITLDGLINCAGFVEPESLINTTLENWNQTINVNLTGTFLCTKYATLLMRNHGGKIINIASTAGLTPRPGWSAYAAAKSGVINFSNAIAEELKDYNIKVFVICPGRTATPLRKILAPKEDPRTIMQPLKVAQTIAYCLKDVADVLEGQPILVRERF
jgi:3-oxoacyl-[acyl-carrier protein] reductase